MIIFTSEMQSETHPIRISSYRIALLTASRIRNEFIRAALCGDVSALKRESLKANEIADAHTTDVSFVSSDTTTYPGTYGSS